MTDITNTDTELDVSDDEAAPAPDADDETTVAAAGPADQEERLVAEGEIAGDYLEELLDLLDFDGFGKLSGVHRLNRPFCLG